MVLEESRRVLTENVGLRAVNLVPLAAIVVGVIPRDQLPGRRPPG